MKQTTTVPPKGALPTNTPKISHVLYRIFFIVFAATFGILFLQVIFFNMHFSYAPLWALLLVLVWGGLFAGIYFLCQRLGGLLERKEIWCLVAFFLLLLGTQAFFYYQVATYAVIDFERVFSGAVNFTINGFIEEPYLDYFYKYPNNLPLTIVLQFLFRASRSLGFSDYYMIAGLFNVVCMIATYVFVYLCCRRLLGVKNAFFAVLLLYFCLPMHAYISVAYTDTVTLPFAPFAFYCYLRAKDATSWKGRLLALGLLSLGIAFGTKIKYSAIIVLIAIAVDMLLHLQWKQFLITGAAFVVFFFVFNAFFSFYIYAHFLDEAVAKDRATPFASWIMMGLEGDGTHNPEDNYFIWYWDTAEEKAMHAEQEIKARIARHTPGSFVAFLNQKGIRSFGAGNLDAAIWVGDSPMRQTTLAKFLYAQNPQYKVFDYVAQGYHVALFSLIIAGAVFAAIRRRYSVFVPYLSILGLYLFLLLWEAGQRYLLNYYGMFIIAAAFAMGQVFCKQAKRRPGTDMAAKRIEPEGVIDGPRSEDKSPGQNFEKTLAFSPRVW